MELFIANTQFPFPLFSCLIDYKSLNEKIGATRLTEPLHGEQLPWSLVQVCGGPRGSNKLLLY